MAEIVMPRLSDTMEEGTILRWLKRDGEMLRRGEELVEIETDKATMGYESDQDGVLEIVASEGDTLAVGELIARVGEAGESPRDAAAPEQQRSAESAAALSPPQTDGAAEPAPAAGGEAAPVAPVAAAQAGERQAAQVSGAGAGLRERVRASPLARRIARESGVDLRLLSGSGPGGRIVRADVIGQQGAAASEASASS